jgi:hypothetical protein
MQIPSVQLLAHAEPGMTFLQQDQSKKNEEDAGDQYDDRTSEWLTSAARMKTNPMTVQDYKGTWRYTYNFLVFSCAFLALLWYGNLQRFGGIYCFHLVA